jgi:hypothetical protein
MVHEDRKWSYEASTEVVRFEVFAAVTMKSAVFWDVAPCRSCVNRRFGGPRARNHREQVAADCRQNFKILSVIYSLNLTSKIRNCISFEDTKCGRHM